MKTSSKSFARLLFFATLAMALSPLLGRAGFVLTWGDNSFGQQQNSNSVEFFKAVSAGWRHTLALRPDGTVTAWGYNDGGQTNVPAGLSNVTAISAGGNWNLALKADGTLAAWGAYGTDMAISNLSHVAAIAAGWYHWIAINQDGTVASYGVGSTSASNPPSGLAGVTAVAAGIDYSLALKSNGKVVAWGVNNFGQSSVPAGLSNVVAIAAGYYHALALRSDGTVVAWGDNLAGQASVPAGLSNVVAVAAGAEFSLALKSDGTVVGWGSNAAGQLDFPTGLSRVVALSAGEMHAAALTLNGPIDIDQNPTDQSILIGSNAVFSVVATGQDPLSYQWYLGTTPLSDSAHVSGANTAVLNIRGVQAADVGAYHVVITNAFGAATSSSATLIMLTPATITFQSPDRIVRAGTDLILQVSAAGTAPLRYQWSLNGTNLVGNTNGFLILTNLQPGASGIYTALVTNLYGSAQANISLTITDSAPYIIQQPYQQSNQGVVSNFVAAIGGTVSWSVSARGSLPLSYQWRFNGVDLPGATNASLRLSNLTMGQSGFYNVVVTNPFGEVVSAKVSLNVVQVWIVGAGAPTNMPPNLTNVIALAAGNSHVLALKSDRSLAAWGNVTLQAQFNPTNIPSAAVNVASIAAGANNSMALGSNGQVFAWGDGSIATVPTNVVNIQAIAEGGLHALALNTNGTIIAWGYNGYGETTVPAALSNNVTGVAAGLYHSIALKTDGKVTAWGNNTSGQTNVPAGLSNVIALAAGNYHTLALKADGRVVAWGSSTFSATNVPAGLSNVVAVAAGFYSSLALQADGTLVGWGNVPSGTPTGAGKGLRLANIVAMAASPSQNSFMVAAVGNGIPFFTLNPITQNANKGGTVQLHARAVGSQPMQYQWQFNGSDIPGQTNGDLTITNVQNPALGGYRVVATNSLGAATSRVAIVKIPYLGTMAQALNFTNSPWDTFSSTSKTVGVWFAQSQISHDGDAAAQSGRISDNQQSTLQTTVTGPGTLTFWWKVSSEEGYDFLKFVLDGSIVPLASISGEVDWQPQTFAVSAGIHTLRWIYSKDISVSSGQDAGWVDQVVFTPSPPVISQQPVGSVVSGGATVVVSAAASGVTPFTYQWLRNGTNLPGATASVLTLTNVSRRDSAGYALKVSNIGGSVTSSNAVVRVRVSERLSQPMQSPDGSWQVYSVDADGGSPTLADLSVFEAQTSTNLVDWISLPGSLVMTNNSLLLQDPNSNSFPARFYRIIEH